ncbi:hypothetical protein [Salirhabdus sp. Marseille-P4669]|uniref:hypothetical protein n=1 Tax=Salirhabdus sp. Marseille-P4669 TaxID=2042310 RepID=UPI000C7E59F6|nr:hypothetical protein [Salirhabdus sp. Marseille-P4669]
MDFSRLKDWFIEQDKLYPLGFTDDQLHFAFGMITILIFYYLLTSIVRWLTLLKWNKVINYIICSLFVLFICTFIELYQGINGTGNMQFSDLASGTLAILVFGVFISLKHFISSVIHQMKMKSKKNAQQQQKQL